jgi:hypothetical protein
MLCLCLVVFHYFAGGFEFVMCICQIVDWFGDGILIKCHPISPPEFTIDFSVASDGSILNGFYGSRPS